MSSETETETGSSSDPPARCCSPASPGASLAELKLYQAFIFSVPIVFTFVLLFSFYVFYLRRRRADWASLRMRASLPIDGQNVDVPRPEVGLTKELREMLPVIVYKESFSVNDSQCSVCLGDYEADDRLQQVPACGHTFHMGCIDHWLATHTTCPLCRVSLLAPTRSIEVQTEAGCGSSAQEVLQNSILEWLEDGGRFLWVERGLPGLDAIGNLIELHALVGERLDRLEITSPRNPPAPNLAPPTPSFAVGKVAERGASILNLFWLVSAKQSFVGIMDAVPNMVHYCSVSRGNRILYAYNGGNPELDNLGALCLENTPAFHRWYFETVGKRTFGFLIEDGHIYFAILDEGLRDRGVLQFLERVRDEYKKIARKGSRGSLSSINSVIVQEKLVPVIQRLITSLEQVPQGGDDWPIEIAALDQAGLSPSPSKMDGVNEIGSSTKAPLLGKIGVQEKKKTKDHVLVMRDVEVEEHRRSSDRGVRVDSAGLDSTNLSRSGSAVLMQKDFGSMRNRSGSQNIKKRWWRLVRIVLAIDAAVCALVEGSSSCSSDHYNLASNLTDQSSWLLGHFEIMKWTFFKEGSEWDVLDIVDCLIILLEVK
ncbi:hypothetical protein NL676_026524 [Syzygium grande]|nr:hypothetical protein NL676_026524 [Syzygium grande]